MKRARNALLLGTIAVVALLVLSSILFVTSGGQDGKIGRDVIMLRCNTNDAVFSSTGYKGSAGTPSRRSENCSENISQLLKDGFMIQDIGHYDMEKAGYVVITMVR